MNNSYNVELSNLRKAKNLTLKQAAKEIGISRLGLFLYENGYFKPSKKSLEKIEKYYGKSIDLNTYPSSFEEDDNKPKPKKIKILILGIIALLSAGLFTTGFVLFDEATSNTIKPYGSAYVQVREKALKDGEIGRDLITDLEFHYLESEDGATDTTISFYTTDSILYFNNATASCTSTNLKHPELSLGRFHYQFGGSLNTNSYVCNFTYGSWTGGMFFIATVNYRGKEIEKVDSLNIIRQSEIPVTQELATDLFNARISDAMNSLDKLLTDSTGKEMSFFNEFLPAREKGRVINFITQIVGLIMIFPSILAFFFSLAIMISVIFKGHKFYIEEGKDDQKLPDDLKINVGIPDFLLLWLSRLSAIISIVMIILCTIGQNFIKLPDFFSNQDVLQFFELIFITSPFIRQFIVMNTLRKRKTLYVELVRSILIYLFIASVETSIIGITNRWGYNLADFIYNYIPSNIFLAIALNYVVYYFLFITPRFIKGRKKYVNIIWRCCSIIPIAAIVTTIIIGNSYNLFYGAKRNIYLLFWFSNSRAILSVTTLLFMFAIFIIRMIYNKKYNSRLFFNGFKYNLILNITCSIIVVACALIDQLFANSELAYYIGFGYNLALLGIIPFILFTRYGVNTMRISHIDDGSPVNIAL